MSNDMHGFPVVTLQTTAEINGRRVMAQATANLEAWQHDERYQEALKAGLRRSLGDAIVAELNPEITVTMPQPALHEALTEELRPFDHPNEELGL
ncbi:hypothetical protein ACGF0D_10685 [Kitasatospora sp. NPDC048298]|uniref:hypothetical protein n=1 Tax=Kitasatospora sp. NPDC048298 TaxID=3364049 RepID=UPI00371316D9